MMIYMLIIVFVLIACASFWYFLTSKIEIPGVKELVAKSERDERRASDLLVTCELVEKWMLAGQPGPHSDSQILDLVQRAIKKAKQTEGSR
jgi:hypothetical protein